MSDNPVHDLKPGSLGVIAHKMKPTEENAWVPDHQAKLAYVHCNGVGYALKHHIPHGTIVMVVKEVSVTTYPAVPAWFYEIIWSDLICLVRRELVINPHLNSQNP